MDKVLEKLEAAIADYRTNATAFYEKDNAEAGKRARKALKTIKDIAHNEWKHLIEVK